MKIKRLQELLKRPEPEDLKLDFKRELHRVNHPDRKVRDMQWDELIKDILALTNGNVGTARQPGYLIIGVADKLNERGSRDLYDVGDVTLTAQKILQKVNAACSPPLPTLDIKVVPLDGKRVLVITLPPTPYLHETTRALKTPKTIYQKHVVFIRRRESVGLASAYERQAILVEKQLVFPKTVACDVKIGKPGFSLDLVNKHRERLAAKPKYRRWADKSPDESYIRATGVHLPLYASPYGDIGGSPKELLRCIHSYHRLLILGEPGMGKTVALERTVWEFSAAESPVIPVLVPLIQYDGNLASTIRVALNETEVLNVSSTTEAEQLVREFRCVFLFDGLNEVARHCRAKIYTELASFLRTYPSCPCVITSRSQDDLWRRFHSREIIEDALVIRRIMDRQIAEYLTAHLGERRGQELYDRLNEALRGLARVPLLLWLIKEAGEAGEELPGNRGELFDRFVGQVLKREQKQPDLTIIPPNEKVQALSHLAFYLHKRHRLACSRSEAAQVVEKFQKNINGTVLVEESLRNGLLTGENQIHFMHQAMHEFFVARRLENYISLLQTPEKRTIVDLKAYSAALGLNKQFRKWAKEDWWAEVIVQLAGITRYPEVVVKKVLRSNPWLAYWCSIEGQPVDPMAQSGIERQTVARLGSRKAEERLRVIRELARMENPRTINNLIAALSDPDDVVQKLAEQTLVQLGEPSVHPLLDSLTSLPERGRRAAIRTLGTVWGLSKVVDLGVEDSLTRYRAVEALGNSGDERAVLPLAALLEDSDEAVRNKAVRSLGKLGDSRATAPLKRALRRTYNRVEPDECARVLRLLQTIPGPSDEPLLTGIRDSDPTIRKRALVALGHAWELPEIAELADEDPEIRTKAARKLGQLSDERVVGPLLTILKDEVPSVRWEATRALGNLWRTPALIRLGDTDARIRRNAAWAMQTLRDARVVEPLIAALEDEDWMVRAYATDALGAIGDVATGPVASLLDHRDREIRRSAGKILAIMGGERVIQILTSGILDHRSWVRQAAANSLVKLGGQGIPALKVALQSGDPEISRLARTTLRRIGTVEAQTILRFEDK